MRIPSVLLCIISAALCAYSNGDESRNVKIDFHGSGALEEGQIVKGEDGPDAHTIQHVWQERMFFQLGAVARINERTRIILAVESRLAFSYPQQKLFFETQVPTINLYPCEAQGVYSFGNIEEPYLQLAAGYMQLKYNSEARNLGEYLFRSGCYPTFVINDFNFPLARLVGFRASSTLFHALQQDLLLTSEARMFPTQDFSVSYLLGYKIGNVLDIGGGVSFHHLLSVNESQTTPHQTTSQPPNIISIDTAMHDTAWYTFRGTKLMGRLCFDPKALFQSSMFGKEDCKIYSEVAVLGVKNYPLSLMDSTVGYDNLMERVPIMFGVNLPVFKILDFLSLEAEYWANKHANGYYSQEVENVPLPPAYGGGSDSTADSHWKWSVFGKKTMGKSGFACIAQVARDHMHMLNLRGDLRLHNTYDNLREKGDWYYAFRIEYGF